jgi:hypothetical protein
MTRFASHTSRYPWFLMLPVLGACSADTVDLGGGNVSQNLQRGSRCADSVVVAGAVRVANQAELEALLGCEEVTGDLSIEVFEGADLSPLSALRAVGGWLTLGDFPQGGSESWTSEQYGALRAQVDAAVEQGYLPSLGGLESLERVGDLEIYYASTPDLRAFESLRSVASHASGDFGGHFGLHQMPNLTNLIGLEQVRDMTQLVLVETTALESLEGLAPTEAMSDVNIVDSPKLGALTELSEVQEFGTLHLFNTGLRNLDALTNLTTVASSISLQGNLELENIDRLGQLYGVRTLFIGGNPLLTHVPALPHVSDLVGVTITNNAELRSVSLDLVYIPGSNRVRGEELEANVGYIEVGGNPKLETLSLASSLTRADYVEVYDNTSLTSVDLGSLRNLDSLSIDYNAALTTLRANDLETVGWLSVLDNPLLSTAPLAGVKSFEAELRGNADDLAAAAP